MILLDGLDEWTSERKSFNQFQTMGLPKQDVNKDYTIVTTSRPWKVHTLRISDTEIEQLLYLNGFGLRCEREMVERIVSQLNSSRHASKDVWVCIQKLEEKSLKSLKQVPIMLQQLICLWFDGKLDKTSRCAIYTGMLELFVTWSDMKTTGTSTRYNKGARKVDLPKYLADKPLLKLNSHLIHDVSQLAYETLFNCPKNKSLTFDISMFDELEISDEVRENCLNLGIITEDEYPTLSVSEPPSSFFSFIHKSMQEFLAAANIGINFNMKLGSSDSKGNEELAKKFIKEVFQKCSTIHDILEQSNVIIMLCGQEPRLATYVSKYIYDTVSEDSRVQGYRRTTDRKTEDRFTCYFIESGSSCNTRHITDIQKLCFEIMEECNASGTQESCPVFHIGDLVINRQYCDTVCSGIDQQQIALDSVLSINVDDINRKNIKLSKYLPMFNHLEKIEIGYQNRYKYELQGCLLCNIKTEIQSITSKQMVDEIDKCVAETIKVNTSTLKSLSLGCVFNATDSYSPVCKTVFSYLPRMTNLVAIRITHITMSKDDTNTFRYFLEETSHLEQIHLNAVKCECMKQHCVNLSKHQQLQCLDLVDAVSFIDVNTTNLEIFRFYHLKKGNFEKIFDIIIKSNKLKELELYGTYNSESKLYHTNITKRLVKVLPLLHNLSKLELRECRLPDNIIQVPLEMKGLKYIKLDKFVMSSTTWRKFIDRLPSIPHSVDVIARLCNITEDGVVSENIDRTTLTGQRIREGRENDAIQYVKDQDQLFYVKRDVHWLEFSTKK